MVGVGLFYGVFLRAQPDHGDLGAAAGALPARHVHRRLEPVETRTIHYVVVAWVAVAAIPIQNVAAIVFLSLAPARRTSGDTGAHRTRRVAALRMDVPAHRLPLRAAPVCPVPARLGVLVASMPTAYVFVLSQRRAAVVAMIAGYLVLGIVLYVASRRVFNVVAPIAVMIGIVYTVVFWNVIRLDRLRRGGR